MHDRVARPVVLFHPDSKLSVVFVTGQTNGIARYRTLRDRRGEVLFIGACKLGFMADCNRRELADSYIARIAGVYHAWRMGEGYADVPGFCKSAKIEAVRENG